MLSKRGWTLSPYDFDFYEHIDEGMLPIIKALTVKGYLTYACCEGHDWAAKRFFTVAFPSKEQASLFAVHFLGFDVRTKKYGDDSNLNFIDKDGKTSGIIERRKQDDVGFLNYVYRRQYEEYYLVEVVIQDWHFGGFDPFRYGRFKFGLNDNKRVLKRIEELEHYVY